MNIGIICCYPIPYGMAATTRIFSYSKGLVEQGNNVEVWSTSPNNYCIEHNIPNSGTFGKVSYFYTLKSCRFKNSILHGFELYLSRFLLGFKLLPKQKEKKYDAFIVSSDNLFVLFYMKFLNIFFRSKLFFIFDEYPTPIRKQLKSTIPHWKSCLFKYTLNGYSGYVSMTEKLLDFYQSIVMRPGLLLSSIIDVERFSNCDYPHKREIHNPMKIVYMGNMELSKDNVDNIIRAFNIFQKKHNAHLYLYGNPNKKDKKALENLIHKYHLSSKISFAFASYAEVPQILINADLLVSSQPVTERASGGFPTKLGEYLMSGTPTLLTDVGETSRFFKNNVHMFFAEPNNPDDFARVMDKIIDNYPNAIAIANEGKKLVLQKYSHNIAGFLLHNFIKKYI